MTKTDLGLVREHNYPRSVPIPLPDQGEIDSPSL
jgi:hypothetical protein